MAEHEHEQDERREESPAETSETPQEPPEEPGDTPTPGEGDEPPEAPEETPSSGQPQGTSEKDMEKVFKALDNEAIRHAKRIGDILEEQAQDLIPCELCAKLLPGFRWPVVDEDQRGNVMLAIGFEPKPNLEADKHAHACPDCRGYGKVDTGSKVQGQDALPCLTCNGDGWMGDRRQLARSTSFVPTTPPQENGPQPVPVSDPERDAARRAAEEKGYMVIDTRAPAA